MFSAFKRPREEDEAGFGEHETKKFRGNLNFSSPRTTLPFLIPTPPPVPPPSVDEEHPCSNAVPESFREWREEKKPALQNRRPPTLTVDTAMDIDMVDSYPLQNGDNLSPWPVSAIAAATKGNGSGGGGVRSQPSPIPQHLVSQSLNISGGRAATPIHGHFTLNMRPERMTESNSINSPVCLPSKTAEEADWWRRRRLPSPISESGDTAEEQQLNEPLTSPPIDEEDTLDMSNWPDSPSSMAVDSDITSPPPQTFLQVPEQSLDIPARLYSDDHHHMAAISEPVTTATTRRKGKISFAMGYRADCEKCQMKVPGHYSHIVRS
ncbi:uncharacterized protein TRUGW13939_09593 [Talaromyces rugulosus]|uniref:Uncharacterized protein n=1 Tax=Talaromyces rugulosus TaxID=121627 RepID=A0A7H8R7R4_TALRU|nr:uncharacterized protein TRUGW13939_09593 [Talaromyces rugulosus]QKX62432.1 hypothetical protein TRUGW13939_09593 [Talaromyces rugulosus]